VKRGEIWTVSGGPDHAGKPRPVIIVQSDKFDATLSITICPLTSTLLDAEPARFAIGPSATNGLQAASHAMVDKVSTVPKSKVRQRLGRLEPNHLMLLNQHIAVFLGLAE
jgi:mRNA interferase MazF